jgi:endonuclease/exonuclease/phosphatase (EEP) superfamily protein YafD
MTIAGYNSYFLYLALISIIGLTGRSSSALQRAPSSSVNPNKSLGAEVTSVLVWNTYKAKEDKFEHDARDLIHHHDLVLFQEVVFNNFFRQLMSDQERLIIKESRSWGKNGVATSSEAQSIATHPIRTTVREFGVFTRKASLFTTYKIKTPEGSIKDLLVLNVHMINFRTNWGFRKNLEQYREKIENHKGPILAAGDFNTWSNSRHRMTIEFFREFGLEEIQFDWGDFHDSSEKSLFGVLDRAFVRGLNIHWSMVYDDIDSSDHEPFALGITASP